MLAFMASIGARCRYVLQMHGELRSAQQEEQRQQKALTNAERDVVEMQELIR
jgi:hypothetical protein